jgi:hypothetical protein
MYHPTIEFFFVFQFIQPISVLLTQIFVTQTFSFGAPLPLTLPRHKY